MTLSAEQKIARTRLRAANRQKLSLAVALRVAGAGYQAIADQLNWASGTTAARAIDRALAQGIPVADTEALRALEATRLDALQAAIWNQALGGGPSGAAPDLEAVNTVLRIHAARVRLFGLDKEPTSNMEEQLRALAASLGEDPDALIREAEGVASTAWIRGRNRR